MHCNKKKDRLAAVSPISNLRDLVRPPSSRDQRTHLDQLSGPRQRMDEIAVLVEREAERSDRQYEPSVRIAQNIAAGLLPGPLIK